MGTRYSCGDRDHATTDGTPTLRHVPHLKDTDAGQTDSIPSLEVSDRQSHQIIQDSLGLRLWQVMAVRQGCGQT
jgi:hypothetical protein